MVPNDMGLCSLHPLAIMAWTLSQTLCRWMPSRIRPTAVEVLPLGKARPPFTATLHEQKWSQTTCITQGTSEGEKSKSRCLPAL